MVTTQCDRYFAGPYGRLDVAWTAGTALTVIFFLVANAIFLLRRWKTESPAGRWFSAVFWGAAVFVSGLAAMYAVSNLFGAAKIVQNYLELYGLYGGLLAGGLAILVHGRRLRRARWMIASELPGDEPVTDPASLERPLGKALGDPALRIWIAGEDDTLADASGGQLPDDAPRQGRILTPIVRGGRRLAVIEHDSALGQQPEVTRAAFAVAGLAIENAILGAARVRQAEEARQQGMESRLRVERARAEERYRIARDLHDGTQNDLLGVHASLSMVIRALTPPETDRESAVQALLQRSCGYLSDVGENLASLVHAIYPAALRHQGLRAAVTEILKGKVSYPLDINIPDARWPAHVEVAAYLIISEALANTGKHARASRAEVTAHQDGACLIIAIADDGDGGAATEARQAGTGLRGMQDRAEAVGGSLEIDSPLGEGTLITIRLPLEAP
jgi:signal transduction histidine kinase